METKINIAEILKNKPQGTKLYDWLRNINVRLNKVQITDVVDYIECTSIDKEGSILLDYSKLGTETNWLNGLQILKPSKEMQDWSKFAWKKGDVLVSKDNVYIIFEEFEDDAYTRFKGKHYLWKECDEEDYNKEETKMLTSVFEKANDDAAQTYINTIEKRLCGKLNLETLEIEKAQHEFKDGDIITFKDRIIIIYNTSIEKSPIRTEIYYHACLKEGKLTVNEYLISCGFEEGWYSSTEEEKHQLFDALAKKGKAWDAEKKMIVDLKPKWTPKPFDKIVAFEELGRKEWVCDMFSHYSKDGKGREVIVGIGGLAYNKALPFNEETAKLIGTIKDVATVCGVRYEDVKSAINMTQAFAGGKKKGI